MWMIMKEGRMLIGRKVMGTLRANISQPSTCRMMLKMQTVTRGESKCLGLQPCIRCVDIEKRNRVEIYTLAYWHTPKKNIVTIPKNTVPFNDSVVNPIDCI
ncbi:hypothetical protein PoB_007658400 [Plakobranchus ocellatus]|uniref:Uncharacterized protein n=1 Tax=Plakobranchus ocellatus TaxID=259542 RepID=A0AAV4E0Q5_9GAST|nr:hypothetical protein PoB_007658400 [Plakobranchus ocellatus]